MLVAKGYIKKENGKIKEQITIIDKGTFEDQIRSIGEKEDATKYKRD